MCLLVLHELWFGTNRTNWFVFLTGLFVLFFSSDATTYAHFLFNAFDLDRNGSIRFEVRISLITAFFITLVCSHYLLSALYDRTLWLVCLCCWEDLSLKSSAGLSTFTTSTKMDTSLKRFLSNRYILMLQRLK